MPNQLPGEEEIKPNSPMPKFDKFAEVLKSHANFINGEGGFCEQEVAQLANEIFGCPLNRECDLKDVYESGINTRKT